jgi:hypothetical protein
MKIVRLLVLAAVAGGCSDNSSNNNKGPDMGAQVIFVLPDLGLGCTKGAKDCIDSTTARVCPDGSGWVGVRCLPGEMCQAGDCVVDPNACFPGDAVCMGNMALKCNNSGKYDVTNCPTGTKCIQGVCAGACVVGATRCGSDRTQIQTCDGQLFSSKACPANTLCVDLAGGDFDPEAACLANDCTPDPSELCGTVCGNKSTDASNTDPGFTSRCVETPLGFKWQATKCDAPTTCDPTGGGACNLKPTKYTAACTSQCKPNATRCSPDSNGFQTCGTDGKWGATTACDATLGRTCIQKPGDPSSVQCGDTVCDSDAKGTCVFDTFDGGLPVDAGIAAVAKLRPCVDGVLAPVSAAMPCAMGVCQASSSPQDQSRGAGFVPGQCVVQCQTGDQQCVNESNPDAWQGCNNGVWSSTVTSCFNTDAGGGICVNTLSAMGRPAVLCADCQPGKHRCADTNGVATTADGAPKIQTCDANGHWKTADACQIGACVGSSGDATCVADCIPNSTVCDPNSYFTFNMTLGGISASTGQGTCTAAGLLPNSFTACPVGTFANRTLCRRDSSGNGLGCVQCVSSKNELGLVDSRCSTAAGSAAAAAFGNEAVQTCVNGAWSTPVTCGSTLRCVEPTSDSDLPVRSGAYCHDCSGQGVACTQATVGCSSSETPVSCAGLKAGDPTVNDCCSGSCYADSPPHPAYCAAP